MTISVSGSVITFSDATTQSTAATAGVTSVNGQTGAVTTTSVNSIGSVMWLASTVTTNPFVCGSTTSGSNLYYVTGYNAYQSNQIYMEGVYNTNPNSARVSYVERSNSGITANRPGNNGFSAPASNVSTVSGTWRLLNSYLIGSSSTYYSCCGSNYTTTLMGGALFVRIS
jgi:hypothetical protein